MPWLYVPVLALVAAQLPEPPEQKTPWTPPKTSIPRDYLDAATRLFDQGLADPRGCEYREVRLVAVANPSRGSMISTRAWVLPARPGDERRFAVCLDGLVHPVVAVGEKADLNTEMRALVKARRAEIRSGHRFPGVFLPNDLTLLQLLRLGEGDLADHLWDVLWSPPPTDPGAAYLEFATAWGIAQSIRANAAHYRADDALARAAAHRLADFGDRLRAERKDRFPEEMLITGRLKWMEQARVLADDQDRRAKAERPPVVCVGPGRIADRSRRIAALIDRLDEEGDTRSFTNPEGRFRIRAALEAEGPAALEPLLAAYVTDQRLTRFGMRRVRDEAALAVQDIVYSIDLGASFDKALGQTFGPPPDEAERKAGAEAVRTWVKARTDKTPSGCWFDILADDKAGIVAWKVAADDLFGNYPPPPDAGPPIWAGRTVERVLAPVEKWVRWAEALRGRKNPSLTDLLVKRLGQMPGPVDKAYFAGYLAEWDPKVGLPLLSGLMKEIRAAEPRLYLHLLFRRIELGDPKALDEYADHLVLLKPQLIVNVLLGDRPFAPFIRHPEHPRLAAAAERLFGAADSPWMLFRGEEAPAAREVRASLTPDLLRVPAFRKALLRDLTNRKAVGRVNASNRKGVKVSLDWATTRDRYLDPDIPDDGYVGEFRACDYLAYYFGDGKFGLPRCELYWPEDRRDKAVAAFADCLRDDRLWRADLATAGRSGKPATAEQVQRGEALFCLRDEGEVRVVAGLSLPIPARWTTLKDVPRIYSPSWRPDRTVWHEQDGEILQAEEVWKDGRWQRFYAFRGAHRLARVPAAEIEFPTQDRVDEFDKPDPARVRVAPRLDASWQPPAPPADALVGFAPRFDDAAPLRFGIALRSTAGLDQPVPDLAKVVRVRLWHAPASPSRQGALEPGDWAEVPPRPGAWKTEPVATLAPAQETRVATLRLGDHFDAAKPGFYRLRLEPVGAKEPPAEGLGELHFLVGPTEWK